jgi:alpha-glucosidase
MWEKLSAIRLVGLSDAFLALRYAWQRDRLNRRLKRQSRPGETWPGVMRQAQAIPSGAIFHFTDMALEVLFLAPDLARLTWQPGELPPPYALARADWPPLQPTMTQETDGVSLATSALSVSVRNDGRISFSDAKGQTLREEQAPARCGSAWHHRASLRHEECVCGLGERAAPLNLRPGTYRMWNQDAGGHYMPGDDPLYLCIPTYIGLHSLGSYLVFFENPYPGTFSFGEGAEAVFDHGALRYYFIPGPIPRAMERYSELTGRPPLPPQWALGYHQSRWGYRDSSQVREIAANFIRHDLPLSVIHLDLDYMHGCRIFTIDEENFGDMADLAEELGRKGVRLVSIIDPGVKCDSGYFLHEEGKQEEVFCRDKGGKLISAPVWPGMCHFPDFSNPKTRRWWAKQYAGLLQKGIAGFWHDMNEPSAFAAWGVPTLPLTTQHDVDGHGGDHRLVHNLYGLLMNQAGFEGLRKLDPQRRPFILSRSGWAGMQRYAWNWTADTQTCWECLRQTIPTVLGVGLSGIPYCGPDIGGFHGSPEAELYLRWFQLATFLPFFRTHSAFITAPREPWAFGEEVLEIVREFLKLRYRLLPYLYTLAWRASQSGAPLARPLFWEWEDDPALWSRQDSFLLGESLLVAPVLEPGVQRRRVSLPPGRWYEFWSEACHDGPCQVTQETPLHRIPLFVRAGSVFPMQEDGALALNVYPPPQGSARSTLFSDAGDGYGPTRLDRFTLSRAGDTLEMHWETQGEFALPYAPIRLQVHGMQPSQAWLDGEEIDIHAGSLETGQPFRHLRIVA